MVTETSGIQNILQDFFEAIDVGADEAAVLISQHMFEQKVTKGTQIVGSGKEKKAAPVYERALYVVQQGILQVKN